MASVGITARRAMLLVTFIVGIGVLLTWQRSRPTAPAATEPPRWPDWPARPDRVDGSSPSQPPADERSWMKPDVDGSAPGTHPVKVKESSGIFHVPGGRFYDRTRPDRCYPTAAAAEADGYRQSKT